MTEKIKEQILAVRDTGLTNMFDVSAVQRIANDMGFYELVVYLEEQSPRIRAFHPHRRGVNYTTICSIIKHKIVLYIAVYISELPCYMCF
jgi:hypothetical protein